MASVQLQNVTKAWGDVVVSKDINLDIQEGEFVVFVGPSGCGKSTLLRMIAGLETVTSGDLLIGETRMNDTPPAERGVGMVFQSYALYPHLSVAENMSFGLKLAGAKKELINQRVNSGGGSAVSWPICWSANRKRSPAVSVSAWRLAVRLVAEPRVFLLDEPLSNLDAALRVQMRIEISRLHKRLGRTMIYVTHDQVEAMTLADKIVVLDAGRVAQVGKPLELYHYPADRFVAGLYRLAEDELPAGESHRHRHRAGAGGAADAKSSAGLAAGGQRPRCPGRRQHVLRVFARNICCPAISPTSPLRVKFRSSSSSATKPQIHIQIPSIRQNLVLPPERRGAGRRGSHIRHRFAAGALPFIP